MLSDKLKMFLLGLVLANFLRSFISSNSFYMKSPIGKIQPKSSSDSYCDEPRRDFNNCILKSEGKSTLINMEKKAIGVSPVENPVIRYEPSSSSLPCEVEFYSYSHCVGSLKNAIELINLIGCLKERQKVEICTGEWCPGSDCNIQCQRVKDEMDKCIQQRIHGYLK